MIGVSQKYTLVTCSIQSHYSATNTRSSHYSVTMTHEYFNQNSSKWNILTFLDSCDAEPFQRKIDIYLRSLDNIIACEQGNRRERANLLLDKYKKDSRPDRQLARKWQEKHRRLLAIL